MTEELSAELNGLSMGVSRQVSLFPLLQARLESQGIQLIAPRACDDYWGQMSNYVHNGKWFTLYNYAGPSATCSNEQHQDYNAMGCLARDLGDKIIATVRQHCGPGHPLRNMVFYLSLRSSYRSYPKLHDIETSYWLPSKESC